MKTYRQPPVDVEAVQWDGTAEGATEIIDWILATNGTARYQSEYHESVGPAGRPDLTLREMVHPERIAVEGRTVGIDMATSRIGIEPSTPFTTYALAGDWIIRGPKGQFSVCKPDIFTAVYVEVEGEPS